MSKHKAQTIEPILGDFRACHGARDDIVYNSV